MMDMQVGDMNVRRVICNEILAIMKTYHEQEARPSGVGTPGGLEHIGDVWKLFSKWEALLKEMGGV